MTNTERTYMALLLRLQPELAACRDAIALTTDRTVEEVQNGYEAVAHELGKFIQALPQIAKSYPTDESR